MKSQKEAERAERLNIKNLVLNYDLRDSNADQTGTDNQLYFSQPNPNIRNTAPSITNTHGDLSKGTSGEKHVASNHQHNASILQSSSKPNPEPRLTDKSGTNRGGQRARKLQLSDVDWYVSKSGPSRERDHSRSSEKSAG